MAYELPQDTVDNLVLDAEAFAKFMLGLINETVETRTGSIYKTLAKLINDIAEAGGFEPFLTTAELLASVPTATKKGAKALDTGKVWYWNGTTWIDTGLSELDQAKTMIDQRVAFSSDAIHTHIFVDLNGKRMFAIQKDGGLKVVGINGTLQEELLAAALNAKQANDNLEQRATVSSDAIHTHILSDSRRKKMLAIQKDGGIIITGVTGTLQEALADLYKLASTGQATKDTSIAMTRSKLDIFTDDTQQALNMQRYAGINGAPAPLDLHKRIYTINDAWPNAINFSRPANRTVISTPYRPDDGVVHPNIVEFYNGFRGYRYILKLEPYYDTGEQYENPCLYGSNDLVTFTMLDGFQQPLATRPVTEWGTSNHNSDGVLTYDPRTGDLILVWRESLRNYLGTVDTYDAWSMRKTKDGYNWTEKEWLMEPRVRGGGFNTASPSIIYDPVGDEWHIYVGTGNGVQHYVKKQLTKDGWELPTSIAVPSDLKPWHLDARFVGNKLVMLIHDQTNGQFRFGVSSDFANFTWATATNYTETGDEVATDKYKASFLPKINANNELSFVVLWTSRFDSTDVNKRWNFYVNQTNFVNAGLELI